MGVIVVYIYIQNFLQRKTLSCTQKSKINKIYLRSIFLNPKYREISLEIKIEFCIFEKAIFSIATKLQVNLLNNRGIF